MVVIIILDIHGCQIGLYNLHSTWTAAKAALFDIPST